MESKDIYGTMIGNGHLYFVNKASLRMNKCKVEMVGCEISLVSDCKGNKYFAPNSKLYKTK